MSGNHSTGLIDRFDPRLRLVVAVGLSILVAWVDGFASLGVAATAVLLGWAFSGVPLRQVLKRIWPLNVLMLLLVLLLPLTTAGQPLFHLGPLEFSREGLLLGAKIALKGNTIVLALIVLLGNMEVTTLGHALHHLRVPEKLAHLFLFTVRYLEVLHREYRQMRASMKMRAFRPRMDRHTYRSLGYLVGMLLVRSFDRSERIFAAMKCRGFRGRFYLLDHFHFSWYDVPFVGVSCAMLGMIGWMEWL